MNHSLTIVINGVVLGLGAAVPIGPVNVEIARRTLRGGFIHGFVLGCGAVTVDVSYAILTSFGLTWLLNRSTFYWPFTIGGVIVLTYLGVMCWVGAIKAANFGTESEKSAAPPPSLRS